MQSTGTVVGLNERGFGFIAREGEEKDLFFHRDELRDVRFEDLKHGDVLVFEVADGEKGPKAVAVSRGEAAAPAAATDEAAMPEAAEAGSEEAAPEVAEM